MLRKILRWTGRTLAVLLGIVLLALGTVYITVGNQLSKTYTVEAATLDVPTDAESIAEGARLARLRGCNGGCHGRETEGSMFFEMFDGTIIAAPDLGTVVKNYTVADLERLLRHGVRPDGTSVIAIMPTKMLRGLSDADLGKIIAFLQTRPVADEQPPKTSLGVAGRAMMFMFQRNFGPMFSAEVVDHKKTIVAVDYTDSLARGRYLAETVCSECHGDDLRGHEGTGAPTLEIAAAYSRENFDTLMREGKPIGARELGLMKTVSLARFKYFTDEEVSAIHEYLLTLNGTTEKIAAADTAGRTKVFAAR